MGNRRIVMEMKHIVNFETWGVLVDTETRLDNIICSLCFPVIKYSGDRINALFKVLLSRLLLFGSNLSNSSLRKQPTFRDVTIGFPSK